MTRARELADFGKQGGISVGTSAPGSTGGYMVGVGLSSGEVPTRQLDVATGDLVVGSAITLGGNSGIISATKFSGGWDGSLSIDDSTTSTSETTGALIITGGVGIAKSLFVGEGISVGGTITYDDVTNIDSVGVVTAGKGVSVTGVFPITLGTGTTIHQAASNQLVVGTNNLERLRVDDSGRVLIGHNANVGGSKLQSSTTGSAAFEGISWYNGADATGFSLRKSRGGLGAFTIVQNGDGLGLINFAGADGNGWANGARIQATVSGTPGDGDMPTALVFMTSADGTTNLTKRLTITPAGEVCATGIVTVGAGLSLSSDFIHLRDNSKIDLGISSDFQIYHDGTHNYFKGSTSADTKFIQNGNFIVESSGGETIFRGLQNAGCDLWYNDTKRIETISTGASVYGALKLQNGLLRENVNRNTSAAANAATALNLDNGMVHWFTTNLAAANVKMNVVSGAGINTDMAVGDMISVTIMTAVNSTSKFIEQVRVDGVEASAGVTTYWAGGAAPTEGGGSGVDTYAFNIVKTGNATYDMIANQVLGSG